MRIGNWIIIEKFEYNEVNILKSQVLELVRELAETRKLVRKQIK